MILSANPFTFTKVAANRYVVEGVFVINAGRVRPEAYRRVLNNRRAAEDLAARNSRLAAEDVIDYLTDRATRVSRANAYCALRALRPVSTQMSFGF